MASKTSYILGKRINRGGMAEIYLGKAMGGDSFERICAVKRILPHYAQDKEYIKMFRVEAHICKRLQHANIVQVYDFAEVDSSFAIIMEYVFGADLRTLLFACENARVRIPVPMVLHIGANAARGLHYAHTKTDEVTSKPLKIIHRDISPQNILISYEGEVKVTDFGIASASSDRKDVETRAGIVKGKYSYMSPEQVQARPLDARTDIFSLAIVLWESLAMKRLFSKDTEVETIKRVQNCEIPYKLTDLNQDVDEGLQSIILKGLEKDKKKRYQTAGEFDKALSKYLASKYPDFTAAELGDFLKQKLAKQRSETQSDIKQTLSLSPNVDAQGNTESAEPAAGKILTPLATTTDKSINKKILLEYDGTQSLSLRQATVSAKPRFDLGTQQQRGPEGKKKGVFSRHSEEPIALPKNKTGGLSGIYKFLIAAGISSILFFMFVSMSSHGFFSKFFDQKLHLEIKAFPKNVQLELDDVELKGGAFSITPLVLNVPPGKHKLVISRPGYESKTFKFQGNAGDRLRNTVYLDRDEEIEVLTIRIMSDKKLEIDIDNGFQRGITPMLAKEITLDENHSLSFNLRTAKGKKAVCTFKTPKEKNLEKEFVVRIFPPEGDKKGRCVGGYE
ncbi:MAG: serine/threonine protein kinase [Oligoflexales bacterium]|nr:serine/threonine protein kinase [Oligoflexales bacterium]